MKTSDSKHSSSFFEVVKKYYQVRHAPPLARLEDAQGARLTTAIVATICLMIILFIIWITLTPVEEIAVTFGEVIPKSKVYSVQHLEGGMIGNILVKEGDEVQIGQTLAIFDPTMPKLELEQIRARNAALIANAQNLKKLLDAEHPGKFSLDGKNEPEIMQMGHPAPLQTSTPSTGNNTSVSQSTVDTYNFKAQAVEDLARFDSILVILKRRLGILVQEKDMYESLLKTGSVSRKDYLALLRTVTQVQEDISKTEAAHIETLYLIEKLENRINHIEVKAPIHGLVKGLQIHVGNVIQPGGILMEIVPVEDLMVETKIHVTDIGHLKIGDPVKVKVGTYDFTRFGIIHGKLIKLSATTFVDEKGTPFYKGLIEINKSYVGEDPKKNRLLPGMTVEADINTGSKTMLEYLLRPIEVAISSSFREY